MCSLHALCGCWWFWFFFFFFQAEDGIRDGRVTGVQTCALPICGQTPSPEELLAVDPDELRGVGLSRAKATYVRSLAEHVISGELELDRLDELPDEQVTAALVAVKGLGQWSADMFLIFHLGRPDVLPVGDLGVRRAVERLYGFEGPPSAAELEALGERWRPYRSLASLYLWESLDNAPAV